jgi:LuxR family transcriptional regulator, maltose regulon positive regulatory protein
MDVSEETVKWHLKNLFSKVNAFNRKHAVARAKLIGLID